MSMFVMIVGGGKTGANLAELLLKEKHEVCVIEDRSDAVADLRRDLPAGCVVEGDGSSPTVLEAAGIDRAEVLAAVTGDDQTNLVITMLGRFEYRVPRIIGRVNNPRNGWLFAPVMGVDVALNQADLMAALIAEEMSLGDMITLHKLRKGKFDFVEEKIAPDAKANGKKISEISLPRQSTIVAVLRHGELIIPHGDLVFETADEVLSIVHQSEKKDLAKLFDRA